MLIMKFFFLLQISWWVSFGWKYYTKDQLIQYIQEYRKEITSQMEWVDNYKMLFSFRSNEVKTLRAETEELW